MATQTKGAKAPTTKAKAKAQPKPAARPAAAEKSQAQVLAEAVVDLPVGVLLEVSDRLGELYETFGNRAGAERRLRSYRTHLRRTVKRSERRGASARHKAAREAKRARTRVEREARRRERSIRTSLKQVGEQLSALR